MLQVWVHDHERAGRHRPPASSAVRITRTTVAAARTPCATTTGTGRLRFGGTGVSLTGPRAPAGIKTTGGALCSRYTPIQRTAMMRPSSTTTARITAAVQASLEASLVRYADHTTSPARASRPCALTTVLGRRVAASFWSYSTSQMASRQIPPAAVTNQVMSAASVIARVPILGAWNWYRPAGGRAGQAALDPGEGRGPGSIRNTDKVASPFSRSGSETAG